MDNNLGEVLLVKDIDPRQFWFLILDDFIEFNGETIFLG